MRNEPRFQNEHQIKDLDPGEAADLARRLDVPYTLIEDKRTGECFLVYDMERADEEVSA
jgi:hypothetical protein